MSISFFKVSNRFVHVFCLCVAVIFAVGTAKADEARCTQVRDYGPPKEFTIEQYFRKFPVEDFEWSFPTHAIDEFLVGMFKCEDASFLEGLAKGYSDRFLQLPLRDEDIFSQNLPGDTGTAFTKGLEMYFLGHDQLLVNVISKYFELRNEGNPEAALVLAQLGGLGLNSSLKHLAEQRIDWATEFAERVTWSDLFRYGSDEALSQDSFIGVTQQTLNEEADTNINFAIDTGYAPAFAIDATGSVYMFDFCNGYEPIVRERRENIDGLGVEAFASAVENYAVNSIASENKFAAKVSSVEALSLGAANALTNCVFDYASPILEYRVIDENRAHNLIHLATYAWYEASPQTDLLLALAYSIQENAKDEGAYTAAARLFVIALAEELEFNSSVEEKYSFWVGKLQRQTIVEAQKLLSEKNLYQAGIDGIAGRGFRKGLLGIGSACRLEPAEYPSLCIPPFSKDLRDAVWLKPYIKPFQELQVALQDQSKDSD